MMMMMMMKKKRRVDAALRGRINAKTGIVRVLTHAAIRPAEGVSPPSLNALHSSTRDAPPVD